MASSRSAWAKVLRPYLKTPSPPKKKKREERKERRKGMREKKEKASLC
jgi:hypothetical protein